MMGQLLTTEQIHEIYRKIANGYNHHGDFLRGFAEAYIRADRDNQAILRPAAVALIEKYNLQSYAKEEL